MYDNIIISEFYLETIVSVSIVGGAAAETDWGMYIWYD